MKLPPRIIPTISSTSNRFSLGPGSRLPWFPPLFLSLRYQIRPAPLDRLARVQLFPAMLLYAPLQRPKLAIRKIPGVTLWRSINNSLPVRLGSISNCTWICPQTSAKGSVRVRHVRGTPGFFVRRYVRTAFCTVLHVSALVGGAMTMDFEGSAFSLINSHPTKLLAVGPSFPCAKSQ